MVVTKNIDIKFTNDLEQIERELKLLGINPLRWAIVFSNEDKLTLSVSYDEKGNF